MYIAIAGNIGSGKTTLTRLLAERFEWNPHFESVDDNPYLDDFYSNMMRWSFNLQVYFLNSRFKQILKIQESGESIIQDRTIYEDAYIFAPNLYELGLMNQRDFETYQNLFDSINCFIKPPDLLIYLKASTSTLIRQIQTRGRGYEQSISPNYLEQLNQRYDSWINSYQEGRLLVIEIDDLDYTTNPEQEAHVLNRIQEALAIHDVDPPTFES